MTSRGEEHTEIEQDQIETVGLSRDYKLSIAQILESVVMLLDFDISPSHDGVYLLCYGGA